MVNPQSLLSQLEEAIQTRIQAEAELRKVASGAHPHEVALRQALNQLVQSRDEQLQAVIDSDQQEREQLLAEFDHKLQLAETEHQTLLQEIHSTATRARHQIEQQRNESTWVVSSVLDDSAEDSPARTFERFQNLLQKSREDQQAEWEQLNALVDEEAQKRNFQGTPSAEFPDPPRDRDAAAARFAQACEEAQRKLRKLNSLLLPRIVGGFRTVLVFLVLSALLGIAFFSFANPATFGVPGGTQEFSWKLISGVAGGIAGLLLTLVLFTLSSMQQSELLRQLIDLRGEVYWAHQYWQRFAREQLARQQKEFESQQRKIERDRELALERYEKAHAQKIAEIQQNEELKTRIEKLRYSKLYQSLSTEKQQAIEQFDASHEENIQRISNSWAARIQEAEARLTEFQSQCRREQQTLWSQLKTNWEQAWQSFDAAVEQANQISHSTCPPWELLAQGAWQVPTKIPPLIRVGELKINLNDWDGAISQDPRLAPRRSEYRHPMGLTFPSAISTLFRSPTPEARATAIHALQVLMLRMLTLIPPGKLRFTIIDPVGLGESFSGFMHLTDYDELLVTNRIWTEANQIESRLADLTEHMENVLQKYLRNEFQTIEEYNESAGEVAEPYHVLVIGDFPAKFSEIAARRLVSIVNSGPRCGVYTLMNCGTGKQLPNNFAFADILPQMSVFEWKEGAFHSTSPTLSRWPIEIDTPPPPEQFTSIVKMVGEASKDARRVEVSFNRIAPKPDQIWAGDSRHELTIPLGRAGATKLQRLRLGKGTSQHMLVAGKTGSGKSTFLHILITNLALHYSPDEVNFFLIDFKKGVEFKDYATLQLPHARVIAVESDREFGVSALNRLGEILQERGELFRKHGVQDIAGYRNTTGQPMPRILLVVDEFQEFFVEDDKIAQNASLLLDRLVRQGRAFGIHVVLGSQTLGGAYSLARSTLGQVAVRVALQCSEADAHLILSEDNTAARLLTRPGEAIYNDANGLSEGNHPFQIAWLTDEERENALKDFPERAARQQIFVPPPIVFEGNIPSNLTFNPDIVRLLHEYPTRPSPILTPTIWLGDAVEIAPPTSLNFLRQSGSNVLIVGQDAEAAQGIMAAAFMSLAASLSPQQELNSLFVLDGSHPGSPESQYWKWLVETIPGDGRIIPPLETEPFLQAMTAELRRRESENDLNAPPIVLMVYHLARFRDLRKPEDDFGMGSFGMGGEKPPEPGKLFADLLSKGPVYGIHALIWCDSYNNVDRWLSRASLREMEMRIAFQMNATDSSNLVDSPAASRLGTHRALLHREETGTATKFRPYGLPPSPWVLWASQVMLGGNMSPPSAAPVVSPSPPLSGTPAASENPTAPSAGKPHDSDSGDQPGDNGQTQEDESSLPDLENFNIL